jgi:hypothetical protein
MNTISIDQLIRRELTHDDFGSTKLVERHQSDHLHGLGARFVLGALQRNGDQCWGGITDWSKAALIDFAHGMPGLVTAKPMRVAFLHQWFTEVLVQTPPAPEAMVQRLHCVTETGFLPVGPGEQVALFLRYSGGSEHVVIYRCDDQGNAMPVHGYWFESVERWASEDPRSIVGLNETQTHDAIERIRGDILYRSANGASDADLALMRRELQLLELHLEVAEPERTVSGAVIRRSNIAGGDASSIARLTRSEDGWLRYGTNEDAWYFAVRINPEKYETMAYTEGDISHVICDSHEQFMAELKAMATFYGHRRRPAAVGYDSKGRTCFYDTLHFLGRDAKEVKLIPATADAQSAEVPLFMAINLDHAALQGLALHQEVVLPADAYQLDLYNPVAFESSTATAKLTAEGFDIEVKVAGTVLVAALDLRQAERESAA